MSIDEGARFDLYERLAEVLGGEHAVTLMSHLPPAGWSDVATRPQLESLEQRIGAGFDRLDGRIDRLEGRMDGLEARMTRHLVTHIAVTIGAVLATAGVVVAAVQLG